MITDTEFAKSRRMFVRSGALLVAVAVAHLVAGGSLPANATSRWMENGCWGKTVTGPTAIASKTDKAKQRARGNWEMAVKHLKLHKQRPYAHKWNYAANKRYSCRRKNGTARCNAVAMPCGIREVGG